MAEAIVGIKGKSLEELKREITCGVCQEHYSEPKILPCQHYYCKKCVVNIATRTAAGQPFSCPECRSEATLPEGGVDKFKTAFNINRLKAIVLTMEQDQNKEKPRDKLCPKHEKPLIIYCRDCDSLICQHCTVRDHQDHDFEFCKLSAKTTKEKLLENLESLKQQEENIVQAILNIQTTRQEIEAQGIHVATNIRKYFKKLQEILDKREQSLLKETSNIVCKKIDVLSAQEASLLVASADIQSIVEHTEQYVGHCTDSEVMGMHTELRRQIELKTEEHSKSGRSLQPEEVPDIGVELQCSKALQQICQTQTNVIQLPVDPSKCTFTMEDERDHKVNKLCTAILVTRCTNNSLSKRHHKVTASLRSLYNNVSTPCQVDTTGAGQYSIQYTPTVRGRHKLAVLVDRQQVAGSPFPVFVSIHPTQLDKRVKVRENENTSYTGITVNSRGEVLVCEANGGITKFVRDTKGTTVAYSVRSSIRNAGFFTAMMGVSTLQKIEVDSANNIYCVSNNSDSAFRCDQNGDNIQVKVITHVDGGCYDLAIVGEEVMICGKHNRGIVRVYDKQLNYRRCIGQENKLDIRAISADCHGNLFCANKDGILTFSNDGFLQRSFGCDEKGKKKIKEPRGLCVFGDYVYVCNYGRNDISVFTTDGVYVTTFGHFVWPQAVCVDKDGFVWVTDLGYTCIHSF